MRHDPLFSAFGGSRVRAVSNLGCVDHNMNVHGFKHPTRDITASGA